MSKIPPPPPGFVIDDEAANQQLNMPALPPGFELVTTDAQNPWQDVTVKASTTAGQPKQRTTAQSLARSVGGLGLRNVVEGTADLAGIFYDPIADAVNWAGEKAPTLSGLVTGQRERYFPRQARARDISDMLLDGLGVPKPENAEERVAGDVGRALTGTALTMGVGGLLNAGRTAAAPGLRSGMASFLLGNPALQVASTVTGSGAAGVAREMGASPGMQAGIGFAGALLPGVASAGSAMTLRGAARGGEQGRQRMVNNIEAFDAAGTVPTLSQATQSPAARRIETGLSKFPGGASVIADRVAEQNAQIGNAVDSIASRLAPRSDATSAGRAITKGVQGPGGFVEKAKAT